jgi:hypothetical protein
VPGYLAGLVGPGSTCAAQSSPRTCVHGVLGGGAAYQYEHCVDTTTCAPPRHYSYSIPSGIALRCVDTTAPNAGFVDLLKVTVPDTGQAVARATARYSNQDAQATYFWAAYALVGATTISGQVGDDICPGTSTPDKTLLGAGSLSAGAQEVHVFAAQGAETCVDHRVVSEGGTLDVWVEDPSPQCVGVDIGIIDHRDRYDWTTSMTEMISLPVPSTTGRGSILVLSSVEGSPTKDPNTVCGQETATGVAQVVLGSQVDTVTGAFPASLGMGHLVLAPSLDVSYPQTDETARLLVGSNTGLTTVFSGGPTSGAGILAFVKLQP